MMINVCDICGSRDNVNRLIYPYDTQPDGAGSSETVSEVFDLCQTHELQVLKLSLKDETKRGVETTMEMNSIIIKHIKTRISEYKRNAKSKN